MVTMVRILHLIRQDAGLQAVRSRGYLQYRGERDILQLRCWYCRLVFYSIHVSISLRGYAGGGPQFRLGACVCLLGMVCWLALLELLLLIEWLLL